MRRFKREIIALFEIYKQKNGLHNELRGRNGIELDLLLLSHSLEKGMGIPRPRSKFGYKKAVRLLELLEEYLKYGYNTQTYAFNEGASVLRAYLSFTDNEVSTLYSRYKIIEESTVTKYAAGPSICQNMNELYEKIDLEQINYFLRSRHSIRSYEKKIVEDEVIYKVLDLASTAPSACNRQPIKVYITTDPKIVMRISDIIPGNQGFEDEIINWAIVVADRNMFAPGEALQWYINGGIYLSYFIEALHAYNLGSCIFQIPIVHSATSKLRDLVAIPNNEAIIAAVGFGYPSKENKFLAASRKPVEEVWVKF